MQEDKCSPEWSTHKIIILNRWLKKTHETSNSFQKILYNLASFLKNLTKCSQQYFLILNALKPYVKIDIDLHMIFSNVIFCQKSFSVHSWSFFIQFIVKTANKQKLNLLNPFKSKFKILMFLNSSKKFSIYFKNLIWILCSNCFVSKCHKNNNLISISDHCV